jgi:hypothetical protein
MTNTVFQTLSSINMKDKVERKGQLDYISWANAWAVLKANYPDAQRKVYEHDHTGFNYFTDGRTCWVKVGITVNGLEHIDYLPVMDFRNNAIPVEKVSSMDVNKTIQRSTAKAIAMHGLGIFLWTGEDIPDTDAAPEAKPAELEPLSAKSANWDKVKAYVESNKQLGLDKIIGQLSRKYKISPAVQKEITLIIGK